MSRRSELLPIVARCLRSRASSVIVIQMYVDGHAPAHFHARQAGREVAIDIEHLAILGGADSHRARTRW